MTYISNSLTDSNAPATLYAAMATALSSAGFTLVDTQVISTRTHKVWKSAAANNSQGIDWYLDVAYTTTGAGSIWLGAFEGYTSPNGLRGPYNASDTTAAESTFYTRFGSTASALETNWTHISNNIAQISAPATAFAYFISITGDRVIAMTSVTATSVAYCGLFDMYTPWSNKIGGLAFPLITCTVSTPTAVGTTLHAIIGQTAVNRQPPVAKAVGVQWSSFFNVLAAWNAPNTSTSASGGQGIGSPVGQVDTGTSLYLEGPRGGRLQIALNWSTAGSDGSGTPVGYLKDLAVFAASGTTRGDTVTISSVTWVLGTSSANRCYGFKAA